MGTTKLQRIFFLTLSILVALQYVEGGCLFPFEHHGTYAVQTADNLYSEVVIDVNRIQPYGSCHSKIGNRLVLRDDDSGCLWCYHMVIRSVNVLQLYTRDPQTSCPLQSNDTLALCPSAEEIGSPKHLSDGTVLELMMYKVRSDMSSEQVRQEYCPINGHYHFSYSTLGHTDETEDCPEEMSHISNCPLGFGLNLHFRDCALRNNKNMSFQCLGDWTDVQGNKFMALWDVDAYQDRPRYRCAMYDIDELTGRVQIAMSSDSSCHRHLTNASHGYERLILRPALKTIWPSAVTSSSCRMPSWAQGSWRHTRVTEHSIVYQEQHQFSTYTARCVAESGSRFAVYTRSHCGEESYRCIWLRQRGDNVLQYQTSLSYSSQFSSSLCDDSEFSPDRWTTEARVSDLKPVSCPVSGEYEGVIPNTDSLLCAKLFSDCTNPEIMFFTVTSCANSSQVYEEREYQCLGTWREGGVMYTYTQRRDALTYECFAATTLEDGRYFIAEAGTGHSCKSYVLPSTSGMLINKIASCYNNVDRLSTSSTPPEVNGWPSRRVLTSRSNSLAAGSQSHEIFDDHQQKKSSTPAPGTTTPPWRPITSRRPPLSASASTSYAAKICILTVVLLLFQCC